MTDTADTLIAELAATDPIYGSEMDGSHRCIFCFGDSPERGRPETHEAECLWRRAKEYLGWK
jgi:hypothetical protein